MTPIAALAPFDKPVAFTGGTVELGVPVVLGVLVADGTLFDDEDDRLLVVGEGVITYELLSHAIERSNNIVSLFKELENIRIDA